MGTLIIQFFSHPWIFLTNSSNSSAVSAIGSFIQALAAVISLMIVWKLSKKNNDLTEAQNKLVESQINLEEARKRIEHDREVKIRRRVAGIIANRMLLIEKNLVLIADQNNFRPFAKINKSKGLPDDMIISQLDNDIVLEIFDLWNMIETLDKDLSKEFYNEEHRTIVQGFLPLFNNLRRRLEELAKTNE